MEDYYAVVGIDRAASPEQIDRKIREQLRIWQRRTSNADLSRRQEAERRVQLLGEARITLLDPAQRRAYDGRLDAGGAAGPVPDPDPVAGELDWLARARQRLADNDYRAAADAARRARNRPDPPAEVWGLLARANAGLGNLDDALYEARQAVALDSGNAQAHLDLAHVHEHRGEWHRAFEAYELASRLDPQAEAPQSGMARSLASSRDPTTALGQLERRYAEALPSERYAAGRLLGRTLVAAAEYAARRPSIQVATRAEVEQIGRWLQRAREVTDDPGVVRATAELERYVVRSGPPSPQRPRPRPRPVARPLHPGRPVTPPRTNSLAIVALVLAVSGLVTCVSAPAGAVVGHLARAQIRDRGEAGDGLALAGIIVGWLLTGLGFCVFAFFISSG